MFYSFLIRVRLTLLLAFTFTYLQTASSDDRNSYTAKERIQLKELYKRVQGVLTQKVMHEDKYLLRFLRAKNHDLDATEAMIRQNLVWRNVTKMDTIFNENWSQWLKKYPFTLHMVDKEGRPAMSCGIGEMDLRRFVLAGKQKEMERYLIYGFERGLHNLHEVSARTGKEYFDGYMLFNMAGFSLRTHGCFACLPTWVSLLQVYESNYPRLLRNLIAVNTPRIFQQVFEVMKPFFSSHTLSNLRLYDLDKENWKNELLKIFPENVLTQEFGGRGPAVLSKPRPAPPPYHPDLDAGKPDIHVETSAMRDSDALKSNFVRQANSSFAVPKTRILMQ